MAGYSREAERQNKYMKSLLNGEAPEKRIFVAMGDKEYEKGRKEEREKEQKRMNEISEVMQEARMPWFCPKCKKVMKSHMDDRTWWLYKHCFDCQIQFENKLAIEGKLKGWKNKKELENKLSYIKESIEGIKEYRKQEEPKFLRQTAADGVTVDEEKWNMNKELVVEKTVEAIFFYEKIQKDIEKELKQYL